MISESQQEQASLYALGLLDADEADAFERELKANLELRALVRDLQESAATLALVAEEQKSSVPPAALRARVLQLISLDGLAPASQRGGMMVAAGEPSKVLRPRFPWIPWSLAALLLGCCVLLGLERGKLTHRLEEMGRLVKVEAIPSHQDALSQVSFCELEPTPEASVQPRAAVLWDATEHKGVLRVTRFAPPSTGKDYQLWAVEAARKEPVNAGVIHVDTDGHADVAFIPDPVPGDNKVVAVAISLEQAGGSPSNKGPILFLGKL